MRRVEGRCGQGRNGKEAVVRESEDEEAVWSGKVMAKRQCVQGM